MHRVRVPGSCGTQQRRSCGARWLHRVPGARWNPAIRPSPAGRRSIVSPADNSEQGPSRPPSAQAAGPDRGGWHHGDRRYLD